MATTAIVPRPIFAALLAGSLVAACGGETPPTWAPPNLEEDFSTLSWSKAFEAWVGKARREYAFTEWKGIDWDKIKATYAPLIAQAEAKKDFEAYFFALREAAHALPDGHVGMQGDDRGVMKAKIGGGFGIIAMKLDDGRVIAAKVTPGSPAAQAGMVSGAQIVKWDGRATDDALASTSVVYTAISPATDEDLRYQRLRYLVRAPVGATRAVAFLNPGAAGDPVSASLTAVDDGGETLTATDPAAKLNKDNAKIVQSRTLAGNIGYVWVWGETDLPSSLPGDHTPTVKLFQAAIDSFVKAGVSGIVIDFRGNHGGTDSFDTQFLSNFFSVRTLYEYQSWFNANTGKMEIWLMDESGEGKAEPDKSLDIVPASRIFTGPVVVMVNTGSISSGEGMPLGIKWLPNGRVSGFWGTNGSFGMAGDKALLPEGLSIQVPFGQSLDKDRVVQLDSRNGVGGVAPTNRIPMTLENAMRWAAGEDVELDYAIKALSEPKGK